VWREGEVMWSTGGRCGVKEMSCDHRYRVREMLCEHRWCAVKEMLCGAQVCREGEVMLSTGGRCEVKEMLCHMWSTGVGCRRGYVEHRRQVWGEGDVMCSTGVERRAGYVQDRDRCGVH
jgi:hypothetical protein